MVQNFEDIFDDVSEALLKDYAKLAGISLESSLLARITEKGITGLGPGNKNETNSFDKGRGTCKTTATLTTKTFTNSVLGKGLCNIRKTEKAPARNA